MQRSNANPTIFATTLQKSHSRFKQKQTHFLIELFEYQEQSIFEIYWFDKHIRFRILQQLNSGHNLKMTCSV